MTNYEHYDFSLVFYCIHATAFNDGYPRTMETSKGDRGQSVGAGD